MTPDEYCADKTARSGSSFYYSFLFLPPERRRAITALYAFCREVDDTVDEAGDPQVARARLDWWRGEVDRMFAGDAQHPVALALAPHLQSCSITRARLATIIDGMQMDLEQDRYLDFEALRLYCHRVAGVVGVLAAGVFGARSPATLEYAERLGLAFQLTNIIRDVGEDARRGRIYLPQDELERFGVNAEDILHARYTEGFHRLMDFQIERAERYYEQAFAQLPAQDRRAQRPGLVMAAIYHALLRKIRRDGCRVLDRRMALTPLRKLWIAWRTWRRG